MPALVTEFVKTFKTIFKASKPGCIIKKWLKLLFKTIPICNKMEIKTEILINAIPDKVWAILTDFDKYPSWNPFIKYVRKTVKTGSQIEVRIEPPGTKGMIFYPKVLALEPNKELRWLGHLLFSGLFDGEHSFKIVDNKNGTSTFIHNEYFTGILVPLFKKQMNTNTKRGFELMNEKLKELAEQK